MLNSAPTLGAGSISGRVLSDAGESIGDAVVMITGDSPSHPDIAALTSADGVFRFDALSPGRYTLLATVAGEQSQSRMIEVTAGQVADVEFRFAR